MAVNLSMFAGAGAQFFDNNGVILSGGKIYTYAAGTTTPQTTYTTSAGNVAHTNPIVLNSAGRIASGGEIWLTDVVSYKFVLETAASITIATYDNVTGNGSGIAAGIYATFAAPTGSSLVGFLQTGTGAVATTVQAKLRESVSVVDFGADPTGTADSTTAIQAAFTYVGSVAQARTDPENNTFGSVPYVFFPKGTYKLSASITNRSAYVNVFGEQAVIFKNTAGFTGTAAFAFNNVAPATIAWRVNIGGLQFQEFTIALDLANNNINSGKLTIDNCSFSSHVTAIKLDCRSSATLINNCIFRENEHELEIVTGDIVVIRGGWLKRGTLTQDYDGGIINTAGALYMEDVLGVPNPQTVIEPAWIKNYSVVKLNRVRFGGEGGQGCIVNNFASAVLSFPVIPIFVKIENCDVYVGDTTAVRLFEVPNQIIIQNNSGWPTGGATHIAWSATVDATAQAAKIAALPSPDRGQTVQIVDEGNTSTTFDSIPQNLLPFSNSILTKSYVTDDGQNYPITVTHQLTDTSIGSSDTYAKYDFVGFDATAGSSGVRAQMRVAGQGTGGQAGFVFATAGNGAAVADAVLINSDKTFTPAVDNTQSLGTAALRWSVVYAGTGAINTSDGREKQDVAALDNAEKRVAVALKSLVKKFRFKDAVKRKGDAARIHVGVIAQEVIAAFEAEGLDANRYAIVCYDEWAAELDEDGNEVRSAGNRYGVRYEELLAFIISAL